MDPLSDEQKSSKESLFKAAQEEKEKLQKIHEYKSALLSAKHSDSTIPDVMARARLKKYNFDVVATLQDLDIDVVAHAPVALFHAWKRERQAHDELRDSFDRMARELEVERAANQKLRETVEQMNIGKGTGGGESGPAEVGVTGTSSTPPTKCAWRR